MKSISNLGNQPAGLPIVADEILELHAARLLLLFRVCGRKNRINGLTKMAKLDFFVRYPEFFEEVCNFLGRFHLPEIAQCRVCDGPSSLRTLGSALLPCACIPGGEKGLSVHKVGNAYDLELTEAGQKSADKLKERAAFSELVARMKVVRKVFGSKTGSKIKSIIYEVFQTEVAERKRGEVVSR